MTDYWVGGFGPDMGGTATGIGRAASRPDGSLEYRGLAAPATCPSYLASDGETVWAVDEFAGLVQGYAVRDDALHRTTSATSGGASPCHLTVLDDAVIVANYIDGILGVVSDGELVAALPGEGDTGPRPQQDSPHAHGSILLDPRTLLSLDLGTDSLYLHDVDGATVTRTGVVRLAAGTGPRDSVRHSSGHLYVLGELGGTVTVLTWQEGVLAVVASVAVPGFVDGDHGAALAFGPGERYLYTGVRGSNRVAVLRVSDDGAGLDPVGSVDCGGDWPRHLVTDGDLLHVANQLSGDVASFRLGDDGVPVLIATPTVVPSPSFLLPVA